MLHYVRKSNYRMIGKKPTENNSTLILVDAYNLVFRLFYSGVTSIEVFFRHVQLLLNDLPKGQVVLVGDSGRSAVRCELDQNYKQNRTSTPPELVEQLRAIPKLATQYNFQWLAQTGWEADDIIFTLVDKNFLNSDQIIVVAADKDLLQLLVYPHVRFWDSTKRKFLLAADVVAKFGVHPAQLKDLLALMGDSSDNIPGVPKIGPKTGAQLITKYGSLDNLLSNLDQLPNDSKSNSLRAHTDAAKKSYKLVTLYHALITADDIQQSSNVVKASSAAEVVKGVEESGCIVCSKTTVATELCWAETAIGEIVDQLPESTRILHNNTDLSNQLPQQRHKYLEDIGLLHHVLYGTSPQQYQDNEIRQIAELWQRMQGDLRDYHCSQVYYVCDRPLVSLLRQMEQRGAYLNTDVIDQLQGELELKIAELTTKIHAAAGREFLISSPQQLAQVLSNEMRLTTSKKTDALSLESIDHPIVDLITEFRHTKKLLNTYILPLKTMVDSNNRVHTSYMLTVTKTGRLSSVQPNLQNIPIRTSLGRKLRSAFQAPEGKMLVAADYDQMELRLLACMGPVPELLENFRQGIDWHSSVADRLFGDHTDANRRKAKTITFGLVYGMSAFGLSRRLQVDLQEAKRIWQAYYDNFPGMQEYQNRMIKYAQDHGYVKTAWGRRCYVSGRGPEMHRQAINAPIQGTAADIIKLSMQHLPNLILQVHDELVAEVDEAQVDKTAHLMKQVMEYSGFQIPLTVGVSAGKAWGALRRVL